MILGRVVGSLWATAQHPSFDRVRLVVVVPEDPLAGTLGGNTVVAVDTVGSGPGDTVLVVYEGSSSRMVLADPATPCEAVVVGIVDRMDIEAPAPPPPDPAPAQDGAATAPKRAARRREATPVGTAAGAGNPKNP